MFQGQKCPDDVLPIPQRRGHWEGSPLMSLFSLLPPDRFQLHHFARLGVVELEVGMRECQMVVGRTNRKADTHCTRTEDSWMELSAVFGRT